MKASVPNRDLVEAGMRLQDTIAPAYTAARLHIAREMTLLDGYTSNASDEPLVQTSGRTIAVRVTDPDDPMHGDTDHVPATGVEAVMFARADLFSALQGLELQHQRTMLAIRTMQEMIVAASKLRVPKHPTKPEDQKSGLCCSSQAGKHGVAEWGDALCMMPAVKSGLCSAHYQRWRRARIRDGIATQEVEP